MVPGDAENHPPSLPPPPPKAENPKLSKVSFVKPGVGQAIALRASPTASSLCFSDSCSPVHSTSYPSPPISKYNICVMNCKSDFLCHLIVFVSPAITEESSGWRFCFRFFVCFCFICLFLVWFLLLMLLFLLCCCLFFYVALVVFYEL